MTEQTDDTTGGSSRKMQITFGVLLAILVAAAIVRPLASIAVPDTASTVADQATPAHTSYRVSGYLIVQAPAPSVLVSTTDTVGRTGDPQCWAQSQFRDLGEGTPVVVFDDQDAHIADGHLGTGRVPRLAPPAAQGMKSCYFPIVVDQKVPTGSAYYQVKVAQRGTVQVPNTPEDGVLYVYGALDPSAGPPPSVPGKPGVDAGQDPRIPTVVNIPALATS